MRRLGLPLAPLIITFGVESAGTTNTAWQSAHSYSRPGFRIVLVLDSDPPLKILDANQWPGAGSRDRIRMRSGHAGWRPTMASDTLDKRAAQWVPEEVCWFRTSRTDVSRHRGQ